MAKRSYKFTDKKHTRQGMLSTFLGVAGLALLVAGVITAYRMTENAGPATALMGFLSMAFSLAGFLLGARGFQEEDVYYLFSKIGIGMNGILFVLWVLIFVAGM